jgi:hypothetical protein
VLARRKRKKREEWKEKGRRYGLNSPLTLLAGCCLVLTLIIDSLFLNISLKFEINQPGRAMIFVNSMYTFLYTQFSKKISAKQKCRTKPAPTLNFLSSRD